MEEEGGSAGRCQHNFRYHEHKLLLLFEKFLEAKNSVLEARTNVTK